MSGNFPMIPVELMDGDHPSDPNDTDRESDWVLRLHVCRYIQTDGVSIVATDTYTD